MSALRAEGLTARYSGQPASAPALVDVDLQLQHGERLLLVGPNGAGKSTLIRVFAGLMRAERGRALVSGLPPRSAARMVGVVSHVTYLYDELTAIENLRFYAELYGVVDVGARAAVLLDRFGITHLAAERVGRLSRGQQQRVALARALVHDPPVLLLDEPDTGLDLAAFGVLQGLTAGDGRTVILTTHNLANGLRLGTRAGVLASGRLVHQQAIRSPSDASDLAAVLERLAPT